MLRQLESLFEAQTIDEIWSVQLAHMLNFGFDRLLYGYTRYRTANSLGDTEDQLVLSNHSPAYLEAYMSSGLYAEAPMVKWAVQNDGCLSWGWIEEQAKAGLLNDTELRIVEINRRHRVLAGYTISFQNASARARAAIGLCAEEGMRQGDVDAIWARHGREIRVFNAVAHLRISSMPFMRSRRALTARQREALEWVAEGKTTSDIATIMGLTATTVEKHLRLAREALEVDTTAQAVAKATINHQIFTEPPRPNGKTPY